MKIKTTTILVGMIALALALTLAASFALMTKSETAEAQSPSPGLNTDSSCTVAPISGGATSTTVDCIVPENVGSWEGSTDITIPVL